MAFCLSKHQGDDPIPAAQLAFVGRKLRNDLHHLVLYEFKKSGLTQHALAQRMGVDKAQISRQLGSPGNWTIDTVAKMLFAINGSFLVAGVVDADAPALVNYTQPDWLRGKLPHLPASAEGKSSFIMTFSPVAAKQNVLSNPFEARSLQPQNIPAARIAAE